nr:hypothetical protein [Tanacetum cinerariifolium]
MAKAPSSQAWLWHHRLSHLNFDTINLLSKNDIVIYLDSFLRSKDETPEVPIDLFRLVQRGLQAQVRVVRTDKGSEFLNQTLHAYFAAEGILHQTSVARTPDQNDVVKRRNRTLVEAARTMLSAAKVPLFFWAEAIATACFTQNRSLVIPCHEKTPYHIINNRKPSVKFFYIFGSLCYIVSDGKNLDKMKEKGDECIFVGCSTQSRAYRVFNKITRVIMESIHTVALEHASLSLAIQRQANVPQADRTVTTSNELDLLFSLMFDELLNGSSKVVSKSSAVSAANAPNQRQQRTTPLNNHTTPAPTCQVPSLAPTVSSSENINQAETYAKNDQVVDDEFINILCTPVQDQGETSSRHVYSSNMHTFYRRYPSEHRWTKDHPLEQVIRNPSQSVRTRRQLESDAEMCMFALTEELHQFDRLDNFDELPSMASAHNSSDPAPTRQAMAYVQNSTDPALTRHSMASVHNSTDPGPTRHSMASVHNSTDPGPTRHSMASVQDSTDPALTRHSMASIHNSTDPAPTCQTMASVHISSDPAPECQTMVLEHDSLSPG